MKVCHFGGFSLQTGSRSIHVRTDDAPGTELLDGPNTGTNHGVRTDLLHIHSI